MKILVLNGSPKRDKSDTLVMTRAFLAGMEEAGAQQIHIRHAIDEHIEPCTGCFACMHNGGACIHDDDMKGILEEILDSDLLLFSFPLYCYGMPAPLKAIVDRVLPLSSMAMEKVGDRYEHVGQADFSRLRYLMYSGCGFPNWRQKVEARRGSIQAPVSGGPHHPHRPREPHVQRAPGGGGHRAPAGPPPEGGPGANTPKPGLSRLASCSENLFPHDPRGAVRRHRQRRSITKKVPRRLFRGPFYACCASFCSCPSAALVLYRAYSSGRS